MFRASILNEDNCGFHARSRLLGVEEARLVIGNFPGTKGYFDPVLDIERSMLVVERPVECLNLQSHDVAPDRSCLIHRGPTAALVPYRWFQESWSWDEVAPLCDTEKCLRWKFRSEIGEVLIKGKANQRSQEWYCHIYSHPGEGWWGFRFNWCLDPQNPKAAKMLEMVPAAFDSILSSAGLSEWVTVEHGPPGYCTWDNAVKGSEDLKLLGLPLVLS